MVELDSFANLALATMLADRLRAAGIDVRIDGEMLGAAVGAFPVDQTRVRVLVPSAQLDEARRVRDEDLAQDEAPCPSCGAAVPVNFTTCWSCGAEIESEKKLATVPATSSVPMSTKRWT